jgi:DNA-directed RNA polymerase subunit RPC12/RpoP
MNSKDKRNGEVWAAFLGIAAIKVGFPNVSSPIVENVRRRVLDRVSAQIGESTLNQLIASGDETEIIKLLLPRPSPQPSWLMQFINKHGKVIAAIIMILLCLVASVLLSIPGVGQVVGFVVLAVTTTVILYNWYQVSKPIELYVPPRGYMHVGTSYNCAGCGESVKQDNLLGRVNWENDHVKCSNSSCGLLLCPECAIMFTALQQLSSRCPQCSASLKVSTRG